MKKSILNLKGAQELSKNEQKSVNGGISKLCSRTSPDLFGNPSCPQGYTNIQYCPKTWCFAI